MPALTDDETRRLIVDVGLDALSERVSSTLAYGDLKRVELAVALASTPRLLLMDEPTAGMAAAEREALVQRLTIDAAAAVSAAHAITARAEEVERDLLAPAEDVRRAALAAFREGSSDVLTLIDAERVYAEVRKAAIDLRLEALLTVIEARFALGEETIP